MKTDARRLGLGAAAAGIVGVLALALGLSWRRASSERVYLPRPLPREASDLAVACLASGEVRPPVSGLSDADFAAIVEIVARLILAYEHADFDSFLALRAGDVDSVGKRRAGDLESLRALGRELRIPEEKLDGDWVGVLASFWDAYYQRSPVARFLPEETRVVFQLDGIGGWSLESWEASFAALRDRVPGPWIQHDLVVPHRRAVERIADDEDCLRWIDLDLGFETRAGTRARLVARFVRDGAVQEWYLHAAASVYTAGDRSERHLIL